MTTPANHPHHSRTNGFSQLWHDERQRRSSLATIAMAAISRTPPSANPSESGQTVPRPPSRHGTPTLRTTSSDEMLRGTRSSRPSTPP